MQYRVDLSNIVWDTDGVSPTECGLPLSLDFFLEAPAGLDRVLDLHPEILHYLHDRYNFNVVDFTVRAVRTRPLVLPAPASEQMDPDVLRGMEWGSHPNHAEAVQQAGRQIRSLQEAAVHYGPGTVASGLGELMRGTPPTGGPPWVTNPNAARAEQYRASGQSQRRTPASGDPVVDAEMSEFRRFIEAAGIPSGDAVELLESQLQAITARQQAARQAPPPSQPAPSAAPSAFQRAVDAFGAAAMGSSFGSPPPPGAALYQPLQSIARVGPWANLAAVSIGNIVSFFSDLFNSFASDANPTTPGCPVCGSSATEFTCSVALSDKTQSVDVVCGICSLKTIPKENSYELHYGDKSVSIAYSALLTVPGRPFIRFCEEIFLWRATYRNGSKKRSRQSVILNPAKEEADENPMRDSV